ncbi:DnaA ATPase domain-containing protein, partial [Candidatus Bipolaricaulota bacterium]
MIRGAPIGKRFEHCTFENFDVTDDNREAYGACKRVAEEGVSGVLIRGKNGLGKTHLLVAMMKEYDRRNSFIPNEAEPHVDMHAVPPAMELIESASRQSDQPDEIPSLSRDEIETLAHVEYWPMLDLTSELRSDIAQGSQATSTRCRECDLLVLDDFGAERATDFVLEELVRIVDWR